MLELTPAGDLYFLVMSFIFGACWGSFLNVCIYRIPREESVVHPGSHCPSCNTPIKAYHNIPIVTWLLLRGKCRYCSAPIRPRYILVEALTGLLFAWIFHLYGFSFLTLCYWLVSFGLLLGTFIDFEYMIIPDRVTWGGMILGLLLSPLVPELHGMHTALEGLKSSILGAAVGFGLLYGVMVFGTWVFKKDAMGFGDVKLMGAIGAFMGWEAVVFTLMISSLLGSVVGISLIIKFGREWQSRIPYGPYIAMAAMIWLLGGYTWWAAYLRLLTGEAPGGWES
jgi:leader peptidase (prepilin peptidase)/N-methyltransferase